MTEEAGNKRVRSESVSEFYRDLKVLYEKSFPKMCTSCGRRYESMDDFLADTDPTYKSAGLMEADNGPSCPVVLLFRNCRCGSTLMVQCRDRRLNTREGQEARAAFGRLLNMLKKAGVPVGEAREELLKYVKGEPTSQLAEWLNGFID